VQRSISRLAAFFCEATDEPPPRHRGQEPRKRGTKKGALRNMRFQLFARGILVDAKLCGGQLSLDTNNEDGKGNLVTAIELLRPHLPKDFVPAHLPIPTLRGLKALVSQTDLDKDWFEY
jgi:hypothetical protein